ncbi:hypothetical protein FRX31_008355 [Thalictrum thalictroides]|uniref:Agenet-like domain-containing protein n=1 Tax=Thalictrum thalictroides TaxID=46969 RepID=A0A7J6WZP5_THATH|nr:hypothetical protein FRX31_008355 [Thalictrum thalictroides]
MAAFDVQLDQDVEVLGFEPGFEDSMYLAKVTEINPNNKYVVKYKTLLDDNGVDYLVEEVSGDHIRPAPLVFKIPY